jgi:hypothetical protein
MYGGVGTAQRRFLNEASRPCAAWKSPEVESHGRARVVGGAGRAERTGAAQRQGLETIFGAIYFPPRVVVLSPNADIRISGKVAHSRPRAGSDGGWAA